MFTLDAVRLRQRGTDDTVVPYADIEAFEIGGPGAKQTGGGFFGGGFGLEAAAEGALIATALNMLTKRTTVDTVICLRTRTAELFLHTSAETPDALRMRLSQVFNILRAQSTAQQAGSAASTGSGSDDVVDRLAKLADMLDKGLITSDEFATLKSTLLAEHGAS
ncbi:MAG: SHOCT domain-containing protein [Solirubrobacteraceae bacterium]